MPVADILDTINMIGAAGLDHFCGFQINRQVRSLMMADRPAIEGGNADSPEENGKGQYDEPFSFKKKFYKFLDEFHILSKGVSVFCAPCYLFD